MMKSTPQSETELFTKALALTGHTLGELAQQQRLHCPADLRREKGWVGMLVEQCLGANAGNKAVQDFQHLGIELKTIPISHSGKPLETTFVCVAPLQDTHGQTWETSYLRQKLSKVLWIPVEGEREIPLRERMVGHPLLWQPSRQEELALKADWEELMDMIVLGNINQINASIGTYLHLRPKAANNRAQTAAYGENGQQIKTLPLGFYLRTQFTQQILANHFINGG